MRKGIPNFRLLNLWILRCFEESGSDRPLPERRVPDGLRAETKIDHELEVRK